jgi:hypothetical protein
VYRGSLGSDAIPSPHRFVRESAGCPRCETFPLEDLGTELVCGACYCRYQVVNDVPILVPGVSHSRCFAPSDEFVRTIAAIYELPVAVRTRIRDVFSLAWSIPNSGLNVESAQFLHRIRSGGADLPPLHGPNGGQNGDSKAAPAKLNGAGSANGRAGEPSVPSCRWLLDIHSAGHGGRVAQYLERTI